VVSAVHQQVAGGEVPGGQEVPGGRLTPTPHTHGQHGHGGACRLLKIVKAFNMLYDFTSGNSGIDDATNDPTLAINLKDLPSALDSFVAIAPNPGSKAFR
jgi:hypothetical protein